MTENKKIRSGVVVSDKMDKSIVVKIETVVKHPLYKRTIRRSKKFKAHDEQNRARTGDYVSIMSVARSVRQRLGACFLLKTTQRGPHDSDAKHSGSR